MRRSPQPVCTSPPTQQAPTDRLTPQELQVALTVAGGASNREAACRLFLSPKTVEYHLSHIYVKLGVASRKALTELLPASSLSA